MKATIKNLMNVLKANNINTIEFKNEIKWNFYNNHNDILKFVSIDKGKKTIRIVFESDNFILFNWRLNRLFPKGKQFIINYIIDNIEAIKKQNKLNDDANNNKTKMIQKFRYNENNDILHYSYAY